MYRIPALSRTSVTAVSRINTVTVPARSNRSVDVQVAENSRRKPRLLLRRDRLVAEEQHGVE